MLERAPAAFAHFLVVIEDTDHCEYGYFSPGEIGVWGSVGIDQTQNVVAVPAIVASVGSAVVD